MTRKLVLTGVMIFFRPGSVQQLLVGGLISAFYMMAAHSHQPYVAKFDNDFKLATDVAVVVTLNIAVMLNTRVDSSKEVLSAASLNVALIVVNIVLPVGVIASAIYQHRRSTAVHQHRSSTDAASQQSFELESAAVMDNPLHDGGDDKDGEAGDDQKHKATADEKDGKRMQIVPVAE